MFDSLFHYPKVLVRHSEGPFAQDRERYLCFCANGGAAQATLLRIARELLVIASGIDLGGDRSIPLAEIDIAADRWVRYQRRHHPIRTSIFSRTLFTQTAKAWFRFLGRLEYPVRTFPAYAAFIDEFADYMQEERGLSPKTIHGRCWYAHHFLRWLDEQGDCLGELRLEQVDTFLALKGAQGWCRVSISSAVNALHAFFRYSAEQDRCSMQLATGIEGPRLFRQEGLPVGPSWIDVQRLIASADTDRPQDIRDRAILLLLAVYGLRAGEVVALTLSDVNWARNILQSVVRSSDANRTTRCTQRARTPKLISSDYDRLRILVWETVCNPTKQMVTPTPDAPFLLTQRGTRPSRAGAESAFRQLCDRAQIRRARADEAAHLTIGDVDFYSNSVSIVGKGRKQRQCPLWPATVTELATLVIQRAQQEYVFINRCGRPITRFGIHTLVARYAEKVQADMPSLAAKTR